MMKCSRPNEIKEKRVDLLLNLRHKSETELKLGIFLNFIIILSILRHNIKQSNKPAEQWPGAKDFRVIPETLSTTIPLKFVIAKKQILFLVLNAKFIRKCYVFNL